MTERPRPTVVSTGMETSASPRAPTSRHAADAYAAIAAWRPPEARRFDPAPANDWRAEVEQSRRLTAAEADVEDLEIDWAAVTRWAVPAIGALVAALLGVGIGSWLQVI